MLVVTISFKGQVPPPLADLRHTSLSPPRPESTSGWPLQVIAITNIVWCMEYKKGVGRGGRTLRNSLAIALQ